MTSSEIDREAAAQAIVARAAGSRKRPSRSLWIASIVVALVCLGGLGYGVVASWNTEPHADAPAEPRSGAGFGIGIIIGLAAGVAIGSAIAARRR